jgi:single-stranded DNA-binding protein
LRDDPDLRYTQDGQPVVLFTLVLPSERPIGVPIPVEDISIRVVVTRGIDEEWTAKKKGARVLVQGALLQRAWKTEEGNVKRAIEVLADEVRDFPDKEE